jgi:hypothetical protein
MSPPLLGTSRSGAPLSDTLPLRRAQNCTAGFTLISLQSLCKFNTLFSTSNKHAVCVLQLRFTA